MLYNVCFPTKQYYIISIKKTTYSEFIENYNILNHSKKQNEFEKKTELEHNEINRNRLVLLDALKNFMPPESNKSAVYKWYDSISKHTKQLEETHLSYINNLNQINEQSNVEITNKIENSLARLVDQHILGDKQQQHDSSKELLHQRLMPIWQRKQREIDEYVEKVEMNLEKVSLIVTRELNGLFKYLQGLSHIWDLHEIGLVKKERSLQELLQDCRRDHDSDNQKREEKLDLILDQMREASSEKDLKRLMANVAMQLDAIRRGYVNFKESQLDLIKQYPNMIRDELHSYEDSILNFFSILSEHKMPSGCCYELASQSLQTSPEHQQPVDSLRFMLNEVLSSEKGTKFYVNLNESLNRTDQTKDARSLAENNAEKIFGYNDVISSNEENLDFLGDSESQFYLRNTLIPLQVFKDIKNT